MCNFNFLQNGELSNRNSYMDIPEIDRLRIEKKNNHNIKYNQN